MSYAQNNRSPPGNKANEKFYEHLRQLMVDWGKRSDSRKRAEIDQSLRQHEQDIKNLADAIAVDPQVIVDIARVLLLGDRMGCPSNNEKRSVHDETNSTSKTSKQRD